MIAMINRFKTGTVLVGCILLVLIMSGCEKKTINDIRAEPDRYANQEIVLAGNVVQSYSVLGAGAYEIDDGTGKLWIVAKSGVPREGAKIVVKGKVRDGFNLGSLVKLPEMVKSGLVLIETTHRAR
jgi:hypothetical protein